MPARPSARPGPQPAQKRLKLAAVPAPSADHDATFDRLVYERVRLGIMSALAVREELTFNELKSLFDVSDGNLSAHARKLEEAKYLSCTQIFRKTPAADRLSADRSRQERLESLPRSCRSGDQGHPPHMNFFRPPTL